MKSIYTIQLYPYNLQFKFEAGTSRGVLREKTTFFLLIKNTKKELVGIGEAGPLPKLSIDDVPDFYSKAQEVLDEITITNDDLSVDAIFELVSESVPAQFPSLKFALETALLDATNGGQRIVFENSFSQGNKELLINGLIWMGAPSFMLRQIEEKIQEGYRCLKLKIGAIDFENECAILDQIRRRFNKNQIELRVDANGAFGANEALSKLERLSVFDIHSIEQPIKAGQHSEMAKLCKLSPLAIALDEELIGVFGYSNKKELLRKILPQYIILKPTLLGGFRETNEWIEIADSLGIQWWVTSALESNVGLSAISQYVASLNVTLPQGLGTGQLYVNNLTSPLSLRGEYLSYNKREIEWDLSAIEESF